MLSEQAYKNLVQAFMNEDSTCIEDLYDHYSGSLYGSILKLTNDESLAQDVLQETFVKIWQNAKSYDPKYGRLFTWMMRIARNTAINKLQSKSHRNKTRTDGDQQLRSLYVQPKNEDNFDIHKLLSKLEDKYKNVLQLVYLQGLTHKEVSDELNLPLGTVKSRIKIGLRHLKAVYSYTAPSLIGGITAITFILF